MLVSAMLFYHKLPKALLSYSFELNPYDPCVVNKMVNGEQRTVCWHVDDVKSSHIYPKVNDKFSQWIKDMFGQLGEVKMTQGLLHDYLGMTLDYVVPGQVSINMSLYAMKIVDTIYIKTQVFRLLRYYSPAPRNIARSDWATQNTTHNMTASIIQPYGLHSL